jgi:5-(carboxyamino)imidazole ribonucleotide synthase
VEFLFAPADIPPKLAAEATEIAEDLIRQLDMVGLLAVELFLNTEGRLLVNEIAPRTHNSGHHTIEAATTSQFEQHLRAVLDLPLGETRLLAPAVMVNLLGAPDAKGAPRYEGVEEALAIPGVGLHLYGKAETRPMRKMGHLTVVDAEVGGAIAKARRVRELLSVQAG